MRLPKETFNSNNVATDEGNSRNQMWNWPNDEIRVAVQSLIVQSVRASEQKSVVVGSNPTQVNFQ